MTSAYPHTDLYYSSIQLPQFNQSHPPCLESAVPRHSKKLVVRPWSMMSQLVAERSMIQIVREHSIILVWEKPSRKQLVGQRLMRQSVLERSMIQTAGKPSMDQLLQARSSNSALSCRARHLHSTFSLLAHSSSGVRSIDAFVYWPHPEFPLIS